MHSVWRSRIRVPEHAVHGRTTRRRFHHVAQSCHNTAPPQRAPERKNPSGARLAYRATHFHHTGTTNATQRNSGALRAILHTHQTAGSRDSRKGYQQGTVTPYPLPRPAPGRPLFATSLCCPVSPVVSACHTMPHLARQLPIWVALECFKSPL